MSFIKDFFDENKNEKLCIDLVTEFFDGKYTREEVEGYLFEQVQSGNTKIRSGVKVLADEWCDELGMGQLEISNANNRKVRKSYARIWY